MGIFNTDKHTIIQFGVYSAGSATSTINFPKSFTSTTIRLVASTNTNANAQYPYPDKLPYGITKTGFTREKSTTTLTVSYIAIGY